METFPVRRTTSVPLRHILTDTEISSVDRDLRSSPLVGRKDSSHNPFSGTNVPMSDPIARTLPRSSYQLSNYKMSAMRPAETVLPYLSRDKSGTLTPQKPQIRTSLLVNKLPAFHRPHSNPNLPTEKRTYTHSSDVIGTKKPELEPSDQELSRVSKSAQNVKRFPSAPTARILPVRTDIHGYQTLTSTPNSENRNILNNNLSAQEMATPILPRTTDRALESTANEQKSIYFSQHRKSQTEPIVETKTNYLRLIQDFLASKKSNFDNENNTTLLTNSFSNSEVTQLVNPDVLSNVSSLAELGVELANQIRSSSSENLSRDSSGKSASVVTIESVLEALRYHPNHKQLTSNQSLNDLRTSHKTSLDPRYSSAPSVNVSHTIRDTSIDTNTQTDSTQGDSLEILSNHLLDTKDETVTFNGITGGLDPLSRSDKKDAGLSQLSTSSSVSFIHLNSQQDNQHDSKNTQPDIEDNKQTNELILSTQQPDPVISLLVFPDFITPTNPFETSATFLTDIDAQLSVASVQPHTLDFDTLIEQGGTAIQPFSDNYQVERVPSHYTIDVSKLEGEEEEDTFLPLTPSEIQRHEDITISKQLEIVSLPQSSVASPSKPLQDISEDYNADGNDGVKFDIQQETSFEYINRFVAEVKRFMDKRDIQIPPVIAEEEEVVPVPPCDTTITPQLPSNMDEMITEMARQKFDELWEDYLENKSCFLSKPQLIRRHDKISSTADSTLSGYNTRLTSSLSDTTLFSSVTCRKSVRKNRLELKPRRKIAQRRNREVTTRVADLGTQTQSAVLETERIPEDLLLSVKVNSVAFLVTNDSQKPQDRVTHATGDNLSASMSLQKACQSFKPDFVTNSCLRQIRLQQQRMSRREIAQQLLLIPTVNKSVQTHSHTQEKQVGTFLHFRKKLTREEIQTQNKRWRRKFPDLRRKDLAKEQRARGELMRIRVKSYQKEILDPVRKSLPLLHHRC